MGVGIARVISILLVATVFIPFVAASITVSGLDTSPVGITATVYDDFSVRYTTPASTVQRYAWEVVHSPQFDVRCDTLPYGDSNANDEICNGSCEEDSNGPQLTYQIDCRWKPSLSTNPGSYTLWFCHHEGLVSDGVASWDWSECETEVVTVYDDTSSYTAAPPPAIPENSYNWQVPLTGFFPSEPDGFADCFDPYTSPANDGYTTYAGTQYQADWQGSWAWAASDSSKIWNNRAWTWTAPSSARTGFVTQDEEQDISFRYGYVHRNFRNIPPWPCTPSNDPWTFHQEGLGSWNQQDTTVTIVNLNKPDYDILGAPANMIVSASPYYVGDSISVEARFDDIAPTSGSASASDTSLGGIAGALGGAFWPSDPHNVRIKSWITNAQPVANSHPAAATIVATLRDQTLSNVNSASTWTGNPYFRMTSSWDSSGQPAGTYYFHACADIDNDGDDTNNIKELDETNNCRTQSFTLTQPNCAVIATNGAACTDANGDGPVGDGWHCSANRCCPEKSWWNPLLNFGAGACDPTTDCRYESPITCPQAPGPSNSYLSDTSSSAADGCVNAGNYGVGNNPFNEWACCDTGIDTGESDTLHQYTNTQSINSPQAAQICGSTSDQFNVLCVQDGGSRNPLFCANRYGKVCPTADPDCCNNGVAEPGETCDPSIDGAACTNSCTWAAATCGNQNPEFGETCDDTPAPHDGTYANWLVTNGYCAYGASAAACAAEGTMCAFDCTGNVSKVRQYCGDSVRQAAEGEDGDAGVGNGDAQHVNQPTPCAYDDPMCNYIDSSCNAQLRTNDADDPTCSAANCPGRCGDGFLDVGNGEQCDDNNNVNGDGCSAACITDAACGNSSSTNMFVDLDPGEFCDDGTPAVNRCIGYDTNPASEAAVCASNCNTTALCIRRNCGDGITDPDIVGGIPVEECDGGAGCTPQCTDTVNMQPNVVINSLLPNPVSVGNSVTLNFDVWDDNDGLTYAVDWGTGTFGSTVAVPGTTLLNRETVSAVSPPYATTGSMTVRLRVYDPSNGYTEQTTPITVTLNLVDCGDGDIDPGEVCDPGLNLCCQDTSDPSPCQLPVPASDNQQCSAQQNWACQGSCQRERDLAAVCDGVSVDCPAAVNVVQSISTDGQVCVPQAGDDVFQMATAANNIGQTGAFCTNITDGVRNPLGCDDILLAAAPRANTAVQIPDSVSSGAENSMCFNGFSDSDMCYYVDDANFADDDEDDNGNSLIDSAEGTAVCAAACTLSECTTALGVSADAATCAATNPGGAWQDAGALACPGFPLGNCRCLACPAGSTFSAGTCVETACTDGVDNDMDGVAGGCDIGGCPGIGIPNPDPDCTGVNANPVIDVFFATQDPLDPRNFSFTFNATDDFGLEWTLELDHAGRYLPGSPFSNGPAWTPSGTMVDVQGTESYRYPANIGRNAVLHVRDQFSGNTVTRTIPLLPVCVVGTTTGNASASAGACCAGSCFSSGACFSNLACDGAGSLICHNTSTTYTGNIANKPMTDVDNNSLYEGPVGPNCNVGSTWFGVGGSQQFFCQDDAFPTTFSDRCDTDAFPQFNGATLELNNFMCGDDADEFPQNYTNTNGDDVEVCRTQDPLVTVGTECFGWNRALGQPVITNCVEDCNTWDIDEDGDGNFTESDPACTADVFGNVRVLLSTGDIITNLALATTAQIEVDYDLDGGSDLTIPVNTADGSYASNISPRATPVDFTARVQFGADTSLQSIQLPSTDPATSYELNFLAEQIRCSDTCAIATGPLAGRCDRSCLGQNGCPSWASLSPAERRVFNTSHPEGRAVGKREGELVFLAQNATDREVGIACTNYVGWEPAPKALLEGDMDNLIKYTQLTTLNGKTVRLVIATWN